MSAIPAELVLREYLKRKPSRKGKAAPKFDPIKRCFPAQRAALEDPTRHRAWPAGRGAAKTTTVQFEHIRVATAIPNCATIYLSDTIGRAKAVVWDELVAWSSDVGGEPNINELMIRFPNGSRIFVTGADNLKTFNRKRGIKRIALVTPDECQDWDSEILKYAVTKVFMPRLGDLEKEHGHKGRIILSGTGGVDAGYWFDVCSNPELGFGVKTWTQWDNPYIADADGEFAAACKAAGVGPEDPGIRREFFAEFNSGGSDRVWAYEAARNQVDIELPTKATIGWRFAWGIDLASTSDNDALVVLGWRPDDGEKRVYEVDSWQAPGTEDYEDLAEVLKAKVAQWQPACAIGDTGGHGATKMVNTFRNRLGVPITGKKSADVEATVRLMNNDLRTGRLRIKSADLAQDMKLERWKISPSGKRELKGGYHSDLTAALRYAWSAQAAFRSEAKPEPKNEQQARDWFLRDYVAQQEARKRKGRWA